MEQEIIKAEKKKTGKTILMVLISVLLIFCSFVVGLRIGENLTSKEDEKVEPTNEVSNGTSNEVSNELQVNNIDILENKIKNLDTLIELGKISDTSTLSDKELLNFALMNIPSTEDGTYKLETINKFLKENLNLELKTTESTDVTYATCNYKEDTKEYECLGHGGITYKSFNRLISISVKDNIYTIQVKKALNEQEDVGYDDNPYYGTIEDLKANKNQLFKAELFDTGNGYDYIDEPEFLFNSMSNDKLPTYTYIFEKIDSNYIFKSVSY